MVKGAATEVRINQVLNVGLFYGAIVAAKVTPSPVDS